MTFFENLSDEVYKVAVMTILGLVGGVVRVCNDNKDYNIKKMLGTIMTAGFAGGLAGALLHVHIADPVYLGAICSIAGYMGQIALVIITKFLQSKLKIDITLSKKDKD